MLILGFVLILLVFELLLLGVILREEKTLLMGFSGFVGLSNLWMFEEAKEYWGCFCVCSWFSDS